MPEDSKTAYAVTELAIRITDLLNGRMVQVVLIDKARYDTFIWQFINGAKVKYRNIPELQQIFDLLEGKKFTLCMLRKTITIKKIRPQYRSHQNRNLDCVGSHMA